MILLIQVSTSSPWAVIAPLSRMIRVFRSSCARVLNETIGVKSGSSPAARFRICLMAYFWAVVVAVAAPVSPRGSAAPGSKTSKAVAGTTMSRW